MTQSPYSWQPIRDYEVEPRSLRKAELVELTNIWEEQRRELEDAQEFKTFNEQLQREWSIETGLLERLYTLDRGVTQILIERGLDASLIPHYAVDQDPQKVIAILRDHEEAIAGLFDFVGGERRLSVSYIKEVHALLTRNQDTTTAMDQFGRVSEVPLLRGTYKVQPNNPTRRDGGVHQYCPPLQVPSEMEELIRMHDNHTEVSPEVEAAWLHHRFTQIHPFQDGNGRVARALATLVFIKAGWFPLVIRDTPESRAAYIEALEYADNGDLQPLVEVFAASQKKAFVQALGISNQVLRPVRTEQAMLVAIRETLRARQAADQQKWQQAKETSTQLHRLAEDRLRETSANLRREIAEFFEDSIEFFVDSEHDRGVRSHYFRQQVIATAGDLGYFANFAEYHAWVRLVLHVDTQSELLVSFHGAGREYRGLIAASACFFRRETTEDGSRQIVDLTPLSADIFQINYREHLADARLRFGDWLQSITLKALELWRKGL